MVHLFVLFFFSQGKLEISCEYPLEYPQVSPNVFVRCDQMSRSSQKQFNDCVQEFVKTLECGELCINSVISWIQEHAEEYKGTDDDKGTVDHLEPKVKVKFTGVSRLWIYSHHIYRKELLRKIPESAKELDLTGFCLPGKPGIICVEGFKENCDEYWQRLKYPNWKHISCKHREDSPFTDPTNVNDCLRKFRLFKVFETLTFEAHGDYGLRNDYHMDLGQFRDFLLEHGCEHMFQIFFGLEAKSSR